MKEEVLASVHGVDWDETSTYDYHLPASSIAQEPLTPRSASRLLVALGDRVVNSTVGALASWLEPGDVVVVNSSKVIPARIRCRRESGGVVELLLLGDRGVDGRFEALVRPSARVRVGETLYHDDAPLCRVDEPAPGSFDGVHPRMVMILDPERAEAVGEIALPPYIHRSLADPERYQTLYAVEPGSVAAPTAGLHLDDVVFRGLRERGISVASITLHVGLGTFAPVVSERVSDHHIHAERYSVTPEVWRMIESAPRVIAIGTTVVRTLETVARSGELSGYSELFIAPGYHFEVIDAMLTNFHVPRSTLLCLVAAAVGPQWLGLYEYAVASGYRFLSFGDAMLIPVGQWSI
ncbi:MAG: tRNA preQ1(34) S-adenosylmethionine ribosyltransferase-isomerase QueA [Ferrimicrobium sp.]